MPRDVLDIEVAGGPARVWGGWGVWGRGVLVA